ncbi:unnamed protein product, partial [Pocillopora meandrina]
FPYILSIKTTETLVHAFVTSKLDHCNSLLYGVPKYAIQKLQSSPVYIQDLIRRYSTSRTLRSSSTLRLTPVNFNLKSYGYRAFAVSAP